MELIDVRFLSALGPSIVGDLIVQIPAVVHRGAMVYAVDDIPSFPFPITDTTVTLYDQQHRYLGMATLRADRRLTRVR